MRKMQDKTTKVSLQAVKMSKILLIESDKPVIKRFIKTMKNSNIEVDHCASLTELKSKLSHLDDYTIILVDMEYKESLNEMINLTDLPFYIMWTNSNKCSPAVEKCLDIGASLFMRKDQDMHKLVILVKHVEKAYISNYL